MSVETADVVSAFATVVIKPGNSWTLQTLNGTAMTLILNNQNSSNSCGYSVSCPGILTDSGTLLPTGQKVYAPTNYKGSPITVTNTTGTAPGVAANLQVILS
jgi:hypothetical protein